MQNIKKFKQIVNDFGLDEKETYIDKKGNSWFTQEFLKELMSVGIGTISRNIQEIWDWEILDKEENFQKWKKSPDSSKKGYYSFDVLIQLGMTLKSRPAREFQKRVRELFKGLATGELKVVPTTKKFLDFVDTENPTRNHLKKIESMKKEGKTPNQITQRSLAIFLTNGRNWYLSELGMASHNLCSNISDTFNLYITGHKAKELRKIRDIPYDEDIRDYFKPVESTAINEAENLFGTLMEQKYESKGEVSYKEALEYAQFSANQAKRVAISMSKVLGYDYYDMTFQTDLFEENNFFKN